MNHRSTTTYLKRVLAGQSPVAESGDASLRPIGPARCWCSACAGWRESIARTFAASSGFEIDALVGEPLGRMVALGLLADDGRRIRLDS